VLKPNWLSNDNATYVGTNKTKDNVTLNIWEAMGLQANYYYAYGPNYIPYEID